MQTNSISSMTIRVSLLFFLSLVLSACDMGLKQLGPTEYGIRFRILPPILGGGLASTIQAPGETFVVWPWERVYVLDSRIRNIEWGEVTTGTDKDRTDFVETRALDGNEVSLAVQIQYALSRKREELLHLVQYVGTTNEDIEKLVVSSARADIRTYMNKLKTSEFFINEAKYRGEKEVLQAMRERLEKFGIKVRSVNLKEHRFERVLPNGDIDRSYQERINQVQTLEQETEKERLRRATVVADKSREFNNVKATVNRKLEDIEGYQNQAKFRGDGYFTARSNEAKAIKAEGEAYVTGLKEQINALIGPGGKAILKLEIAKSLQKSRPKFVVTGSAKGESNSSNDFQVNRIDSNRLLDQIGVFEALKDERPHEKPQNIEKTEQNDSEAKTEEGKGK